MSTAQTSFDTEQQQLRLVFFLLLIIAALLRCYMVGLDMNILLDQGLVQDDAFYYFVIARNIVEHGHASFDNINLTNGFHPLWQAICLPVFYIWHGDTPIRIMLAIAAGFDLLSIYFAFLILQNRLKNPTSVLFGIAILGFHGTLVRTWFNGLETALSIFSLLWLLHQFLIVTECKSSAPLREHGKFASIAAFAFLARTDNAIIIVSLFAFLYIPPLILRRRFKTALVANTILIALVAPWLLWNIVNFGSIVQISGQIKDNTWLVEGRPIDMPFIQNIVYSAWISLTPIKIVFEKMFSPNGINIPGYIGLLIIIAAVYLAQKIDHFFKKQLLVLLPFITGVVVLFLYHAGVRHFVRGWYNAPVLLTLTLLLTLLFDLCNSRLCIAKNKLITPVLFLLGLLFLYSPYSYTRKPANFHLDPRIAAAHWLNSNTPENSLVAAANAGIVGYYTQRPVINLDGVVNEKAFHARLDDQLQRYIFESQVNYIADHKGSIQHLCRDNVYYTCLPLGIWDDSTLVMQVERKML